MPTLAPSSNMNARAWLDEQLNGNGPVGLPWNSLLAFLRIVTNPRIFQKPEAMRSAGHAGELCRRRELLGDDLAGAVVDDGEPGGGATFEGGDGPTSIL